MSFFNNHVHSEYSNIRLLDAIGKGKKIIDTAVEQGLLGIAFTDHENLSIHPEINEYAKEIREKYPNFVIGLGDEIYLVDERKSGIKYYHFILIAKNERGHRALNEISSLAWFNMYSDRGMERVPITKDELSEIVNRFPGTLIATTACLGSEISQEILALTKAEKEGNENEIYEHKLNIHNFISYCKNLFKDDFYLECQPAQSKEQVIVNKRFLSIAEAYDLKITVATDAHYIDKNDRWVHKSYLNSKGGERETDSFYEYTYMQSPDEVVENLSPSYDKDMIENIFQTSSEIAQKIEFYDLSHKQSITEIPVKNYPKIKGALAEYKQLSSMYNSDNIQKRYWVNQCVDKLKEKGLYNEKYLARLEEEAETKEIISEKLETNMFAYPITLQHYIDLFWDCGSIVGAGRGSSCSGLNHYLLGVTQLDPIKHNLPWFRYMNRERVEIGDIDLDLAPSKRPLIIKKIREERKQYFNEDVPEWAKENLGCVLVATFGTETAKSAILTACFKKGTKVDTLEGEKNIEEVQSGDLVKTLDGYEKVICPTIFKGTPNIFVKTKNYINKGFYCTPDHEILTIKSYRRTEGKNITSKMKELFPELKEKSSLDKTYDLFARNFREVSPSWTQAQNITKEDYGLTLIDNEVIDTPYIFWKNDFHQKFGIGISEKIEISNDFCELIGIWIAEGSINKRHNQISFTIHQKEEKLQKRIIELMWKIFQLDNVCITTRMDSKALTISYSSSQLAQFFFELFDNKGEWKEKRADNTYHYLTQWDKRVPRKLMKIDPQKQLQIIKGWFLGDGYAYNGEKRSRSSKWTTVSKNLARDMIEIFHRNYINPSVDIDERSLTRTDRCDCFNISLYGEYATILYNLKYNSDNFNEPLIFPIEIRRKDDIPVVYNNKLYMKNKLEMFQIENVKEEKVYCLKMPNSNFSVNNTIVHNCRGYRSEECPDGIDVDEAQYISSLVPQERGFLWNLHDVVYGNPDKDRKPIAAFVREVNLYPGLLDIMLSIEGIRNKRSSHASGVILFEGDPFEHCAFMRTPKGELITQYDLHRAEMLGMTKYDFLVTEIQDKLGKTIELLQKDNVIDSNLSLREAYNKYFEPESLPINESKYWDAICNQKVLNLFQFDSLEGSKGIAKIQPRTIEELSDTNGLIRLMGDGEERPIEKYARQKKDISLWYAEMDRYGLTKEEQKYLEPYFKQSYGVPPSQEQMMLMLMDEHLCGFSLKDANKARKIVGKKKMSEIPALHQKILESAQREVVGKYIWERGVGPQVGYSFSCIHALAYSFIGFQTAFAATYWDSIYWNTACLIVNSGGTDPEKGGSTDYAKTAKAIGDITSEGIKVSLIDINSSQYDFIPDVKNNQILYGLKGLNKVGDDVIKNIIANRPYGSVKDFIEKVKPNKTVMISLIRSGAFDKMENRMKLMGWYIWNTCDKKNRLTLQNMRKLILEDLVPSSLSHERAVFEFNRYLKAVCKFDTENYKLDERALSFIENNYLDLFSIVNYDKILNIKQWDKIYQKEMDGLRNWLKEDGEEVLFRLNEKIFKDNWNKYVKRPNYSSWEMESMCFYFHEHELKNINNSKYGLRDYESLSREPIVAKTFEKGGRTIRMYSLCKIIGTVIAKDKNKSVVYLLTRNGTVVPIKFRKDYFTMFDRQISQLKADGKKKVVEKSWFQRGSMIVVNGMRQEDSFVAKKYASQGGHTLYRVSEIDDFGNIMITSERARGIEEEGDE